MVFILILGGLIGVVQASGAFKSGLLALTQKTKGREFLLIFFVSILMVLGGTLCGIEEEAVACYPILVPIFIAMGYDSIVCVGAIFLASSMGSTFSTITPFSVVIASNAAGTTFAEGLYWRIAGCIVGAMFVIPFPVMVWGVMSQGWWFPTMASAFLIFTIIIMFLAATGPKGLGEQGVVDEFVKGASSLVGVSLIIGLARGINLVLNNGRISDTILHFSSSLVENIQGPLFVIALLFIFFFLGFIIPSSSGLVVLAMPIFTPLADTVGIPRYTIVSAYQFGQYAMLFLAPTGLVMATLQMLNMRYSHWFRFVWPVVVFVLVFGGGMLVTQVLLH